MDNGGITFAEDLENLLDSLGDYEDFDEADEPELIAERQARPTRAARNKVSFLPRPSRSPYVTQVQMQTTVAKLDKRISTLASDTSKQLNQLKQEHAKQATILKKEFALRKKEMDASRKELRQLRDMSVLLPLLSRPSSVTLTSEAGGIPAGSKVMVDKGDTMSMLLPMLLMGGIGGTSGSGIGGESGDNSMMMIVLMMALSK